MSVVWLCRVHLVSGTLSYLFLLPGLQKVSTSSPCHPTIICSSTELRLLKPSWLQHSFLFKLLKDFITVTENLTPACLTEEPAPSPLPASQPFALESHKHLVSFHRGTRHTSTSLLLCVAVSLVSAGPCLIHLAVESYKSQNRSSVIHRLLIHSNKGQLLDASEPGIDTNCCTNFCLAYNQEMRQAIGHMKKNIAGWENRGNVLW